MWLVGGIYERKTVLDLCSLQNVSQLVCLQYALCENMKHMFQAPNTRYNYLCRIHKSLKCRAKQVGQLF